MIYKVIESKNLGFEEIKFLAKIMLPSHAFNFLEDCGLISYGRLGSRLLKSIDVMQNIEEFSYIFSVFAIYTNQTHLWCLNYFPWHHGKEYQYK